MTLKYARHQLEKVVIKKKDKLRCVCRFELIKILDGFLGFLLSFVLHCEGNRFIEDVQGISGMNELIEFHEKFIKGIWDRCLLSRRVSKISFLIIIFF